MMFEKAFARIAARDEALKESKARYPEPVVVVQQSGLLALTCLGALKVGSWESAGVRHWAWGHLFGQPRTLTAEDAAAVAKAAKALERAHMAYRRALAAAHKRGKDVDLETGKRIQAERDGGKS